MIRVQTFPCTLAKAEADALNQESGRIYTNTLVWHYRIFRRTGHWLSEYTAKRLEDYLGGSTILHAHSRDAAQEGFYDACKVTTGQRKIGRDMRYPHRRKVYRTTTWKNTGIRLREGALLLACARGSEPIHVVLPENFHAYSANAYKQVELVWDHAARHYAWHVTLEDGVAPAATLGRNIVAVDLGEIHPAALTDGKTAAVITARRLRATYQYTAKRLAEIQAKQADQQKSSRRWKRLQGRKTRFLAQQDRRARDIIHKVSRAVVEWATEQQAGTLVIGDVRDVADKTRVGAMTVDGTRLKKPKRLSRQTRQKISNWPHGKVRQSLTYKAHAAGMTVELGDEHHTSKTCPACGRQSKPRGRVYRCPTCRFVAHRDIVGSVNILSRKVHGEVSKILPPPLPATTYRYPAWQGKRSRLDTAQVARLASAGREAAGL